MKHFIRYISLLSAVALLLLSACRRDEAQERRTEPYTGERIPLEMRFKAGDAVVDESTIVTARIIVFNDQGQLVYNDISEAQAQTGVYLAKAEAARGFNNFYVICNEPESLTAKLEALTEESDIETTGFNAVGINLPLPMYGAVPHAYVSAKSNGSDATVAVDNVTTTYLPVKVTRMLAKISFTAIKNIATPEEDFKVQELRIRVCRMPVVTTIGENRPYTGTEWSTDLTATGTGTLDNNGSYTVVGDVYTIPDGVDRVTFPDLYIPEHLLEVAADRSKATYLIVDATCKMKNGSTQMLHSTYQVNIGEKPTESFNLRRNNHYKIYATITGIGAMGLFAEIQTMDEFNIAINWKPVDGLVIVSDKISDYDLVADVCKNINIWSDYSAYSGILKTYHADKGYNDISFKYGSLIAVRNNLEANTAVPFVPPVSADNLEDILWYPSSYGNPYTKITNWGEIPYVAAGADIPLDNSQVTQGYGDPCKLVGLSPEQIFNEGIVDNKQWHMATPEEYALLQLAANNETNALGYKSFHYIMAPNVKVRASDGELSATKNGGGHYWTTRLSSAFGFVSATPAGAGVNAQDPQNGYAVRCVRNVIPETKLSVTGEPNFSYRGNITSGSAFAVTTNIPYWTATLIEDPTDPEIGDSRDFADFSFAPGGTNVKMVSGGFNGTVSVYLPRRESQISRTFRIRVQGVGFDGQTETVYVNVKQEGYSINVDPLFNPLADDKDHWIPAAGREYILTLNVTPTDIAVPAGYLIVVASYLGKEIARTTPIPSVADQYQYTGIPITIPENKTPDPIGIIFNAVLVDTPVSYVSPTEVDAYCLQDKY